MHLDFFYVLGYDILVVADTLDPDQLILLLHVFFKVLINHFASLDSRVGPIQNCDLVLRDVYKFNKLVKTYESDLVTQLDILLVVREKVVL